MRYTAAHWYGANPADFSTQPIGHKRIVIHIEQGTGTGVINWFNNPHAKVSAHFGNPRYGKVQQFVDTDQMAYHCAQWNADSLGIEHEGYSGQRLNGNQLRNLRALLLWIRKVHKIPLDFVVTPDKPGVIGHGHLPEGSLSHPNCPGGPILVQVNSLLASIHRRDRLWRLFGRLIFWHNG
jgi:hypothetical protein